jgi:hypothetical protein
MCLCASLYLPVCDTFSCTSLCVLVLFCMSIWVVCVCVRNNTCIFFWGRMSDYESNHQFVYVSLWKSACLFLCILFWSICICVHANAFKQYTWLGIGFVSSGEGRSQGVPRWHYDLVTTWSFGGRYHWGAGERYQKNRRSQAPATHYPHHPFHIYWCVVGTEHAEEFCPQGAHILRRDRDQNRYLPSEVLKTDKNTRITPKEFVRQ